MAAAIALKLASDALARHVGELARRAVAAWASRWGASDGDASIHAAPWHGASLAVATAGQWFGAPGQGKSALFWPEAASEAIEVCLFGAAGGAGSLAGEASAHVAQALRDMLFSAWGSSVPTVMVDPPIASRWDALVHLTIELGPGLNLLAVVDGTRCGVPAGLSKPALASVSVEPTIFHSQPASATLVIGSASIGIPDAVALQVGDVIVLDSDIREPVMLRLASGETCIPVHLGHAGGARAAQIAPSCPR